MAPPASLSGLPPGAQELIGPRRACRLEAFVEPDREAIVPEPRARWRRHAPRRSAALRLRGRYARGRVSPRHSRACPPRARASASPSPVRLTLRAGLAGSVDIPVITLDGTIDRLAFAGQTVDQVTLAGEVNGPIDSALGLGQARRCAGAAGTGSGHWLPARRRPADAHRPDGECPGHPTRRRGGGGAGGTTGARPAGGRGARPRRAAGLDRAEAQRQRQTRSAAHHPPESPGRRAQGRRERPRRRLRRAASRLPHGTH